MIEVAFADDYLADPTATRPFPGVDPAYLDVLNQVYDERFLYYRGLMLAEAHRIQRMRDEAG